MIGEQERQQIADAIVEVERRTDAELVTVIAAASDDYRYIPLLWSALAALLVPLAAVFVDMRILMLVSVQLGVFIVAALVLGLTPLGIRAIPRNVRRWRAANMARRQFIEQGLHHTDGDTGLLIFVSEAERYVEILADRGISDHVDDSRWQAIVTDFVVQVRAGRVLEGFLSAIEQCGAILAETVPKTGDNPNELGDRLILIGYDDT